MGTGYNPAPGAITIKQIIDINEKLSMFLRKWGAFTILGGCRREKVECFSITIVESPQKRKCTHENGFHLKQLCHKSGI